MCGLLSGIGLGTLLAAILTQLAPVYVICLIVGGGMLVVSTVFGGHGHDADVDVGGFETDVHLDADAGGDIEAGGDFDGGADLGGDVDVHVDGAGHVDGLDAAHAHEAHHALELSSWFSVRFLVYFAATFGLVGTVLTYMSDISAPVVLVAAVVSGLVIGQGVHQAIRALQRSSGGGDAKVADFVNRPARVTIAVQPPARGEVGVCVGNKEYFLPAVAKRGDDRFRVGDRVVVTGYSAGTAEIVSREEYAFVNDG